jgi:hypothetical protein
MGVSVQCHMQPAANFPEYHRFNIPFYHKCNIPTLELRERGFSL